MLEPDSIRTKIVPSIGDGFPRRIKKLDETTQSQEETEEDDPGQGSGRRS
jgi:hypothetical protein